MREYRRYLERANQAQPRHIGRRHRRDVLALVEDLTRRRPEKLGEQIETGRLAGTVRANQGVNTAAPHLEADVAYSKESREFLGQSVGFENELIRQSNSPARPSPRRLGSRAWLIVIFTAGFPKGLKIPRFVSRVKFARDPPPPARNMPSTPLFVQGGKRYEPCLAISLIAISAAMAAGFAAAHLESSR